jgi:hypothetical protein
LYAGSYVQLHQPDSNGTALLEWHASAFTSQTSHADIWHGTFQFLTPSFTQIVSSGKLEGAPMAKIYRDYAWTRYVEVSFDPAFFQVISQVRWWGSC